VPSGCSHRSVLSGREFRTLLGLEREEMADVAGQWPNVRGAKAFLAVNNALANLLGYPHGEDDTLASVLEADPGALVEALETWQMMDEPKPLRTTLLQFVVLYVETDDRVLGVRIGKRDGREILEVQVTDLGMHLPKTFNGVPVVGRL
jgi:hypothetical protein